MNLTSYRRLLIALGKDEPLADNYKHKRRFLNWIPAISSRVEQFLNRDLELTSYTHYYDTIPETIQYYVTAYPISSITSLYEDSTGVYDGDETEIDSENYHVGKDSQSLVLNYVVTPAKRGLRAIYTGGLASHGVQSQFTLSSEGTTPLVAGVYVEGRTSSSVGYVIAKTGSAITIEVLYGKFEVGEIIDGKATETGSVTTDQYATLATNTVRCLAELYPDIVEACELEIRYMDDHRSDYEVESHARGSTDRKDLTKEYDFLPETRSLLETYRNIHI